MTNTQHLRDQASRAERLARYIVDTVTATRLVEAAQDYRREADRLELCDASHSDRPACITPQKIRTER